jgi:16S rRNA (guanine1207-N2)-methyltransferase
MTDAPVLAVLRAALPRAADGRAPATTVHALRAVPGLAALLPGGPLRAEQGFKPFHDALRAEGLAVVDGVAERLDDRAAAPGLVVVLPPRSRDEGRALLARAWLAVAPGGAVLAAAMNDEGAKSFEKDLAAIAPLAGVVSKAHGRAFWTAPRPASPDADALALAARWEAVDAPRFDAATGGWTRPGVFNEGRLDVGSALLLQHLPRGLRGRVADLGAGSGLLARAVLAQCPEVAAVDLFEAEARAVDLARRHLDGARAPVGLHWCDLSAGLPESARARFDAVVCNPPFHIGSRGVPALGRAFIAAAARALKRDGQLLLVANRHLPYEEALREAFGHGEALAEQGGFKVYRAWSPRAAA